MLHFYGNYCVAFCNSWCFDCHLFLVSCSVVCVFVTWCCSHLLPHAVNCRRRHQSVVIFGRPFVETVRPMLSDRCLSVCPVCNVGVLWPNGWMDQDETWQRGRPRPRPHYVRWGPSSPKGEQPPPLIFGLCIVAKQLDGMPYSIGRP